MKEEKKLNLPQSLLLLVLIIFSVAVCIRLKTGGPMIGLFASWIFIYLVSMILVTLIVGYITSLISCSQPMSHVLTGRLMAPVFKERKVAPEILSRCLEDSGTMAGPMIPWHGYGVYMAGTLGVAWAAFFPYLFLLYLTPIFSIIYGFTGISIKHVSGEEVAE